MDEYREARRREHYQPNALDLIRLGFGFFKVGRNGSHHWRNEVFTNGLQARVIIYHPGWYTFEISVKVPGESKYILLHGMNAVQTQEDFFKRVAVATKCQQTGIVSKWPEDYQ